jgi:hypothetical protein
MIPAVRAARRLSANTGCTGTVTVVLPRLFSVAICTAILRTMRYGRSRRSVAQVEIGRPIRSRYGRDARNDRNAGERFCNTAATLQHQMQRD